MKPNKVRDSIASSADYKVQVYNYPPKPYKVLPCLFRAYTTSMAVTVFLLACSV